MLTDLTWLQPYKTFPPDVDRIADYERRDKLYAGRHHEVWHDLWDFQELQDVSSLISQFFNSTSLACRKLEFNWFQVVCNVFSDFLVGEPPRLIGNTTSEQTEIDNIRDRSDLNTALYKASVNVIKYNHAILKVRFRGAEDAEPGSIIENIKPSVWFGIHNPDNEDEYTAHVLAYTLTAPVGSSMAKFLKVEIHTPNKIVHELYWMNGNIIDHLVPLNTIPRFASLMPSVDPLNAEAFQPLSVLVETGIPYPLVFVIKSPNDDFTNIENLVHELELRIIKVASILDIHSRPIMAGPDNVVETDMETGESVVKMAGNYFPIKKQEERPTYIEWDGKLDSSFKEMNVTTDMLYKITDLSPAALGDYNNIGGSVPLAGSAWRRLLIRTLSKTSRIRTVFDVPLRRAINAASILDVNGRMAGSVELKMRTIGWQDGLPRDMMEDTTIEQKRKNSGLTSKLSSIMRLDECSLEEAQTELDRMSKEIPDAPREQSPFEARLRNPEDKQPRADQIDVMK